MKILIFLIKVLVVSISGYIIHIKLTTQNTSTLQALTSKDKGIVNKIFSPKQLNEIEIAFYKLSIPYNTITVCSLIFFGIITFLIIFAICNLLFPLKSISLIISLPFSLLPFWIIKYISSIEQNKLEIGLNDFFIQLKSALRVNQDIVEALRRIQNTAIEPFKKYTKQLLIEINAGKLPEKALESFAQKINIKRFDFYINNIKYCQAYGGDIGVLTDKTQAILSDTLKQKKKRLKESKSIRTVLYILIGIDIYMYFFFIGSNEYYMNTMINSFMGRSILNINFISIWGIVWLSKIVKKFDY